MRTFSLTTGRGPEREDQAGNQVSEAEAEAEADIYPPAAPARKPASSKSNASHRPKSVPVASKTRTATSKREGSSRKVAKHEPPALPTRGEDEDEDKQDQGEQIASDAAEERPRTGSRKRSSPHTSIGETQPRKRAASGQASRTPRGDEVEDNTPAAGSGHDAGPSGRKPWKEEETGADEADPRAEATQWQVKFDLLLKEKEALQTQFDELYELRHTKAEKLLTQLQHASDERDRRARETIDLLRKQLNTSSSSASSSTIISATGRGVPSSPSPPTQHLSTAMDPQSKRPLTAQEAVDLLVAERNKNKDTRVNLQETETELRETRKLLDAEVANSKALLARSRPGGGFAGGALGSSHGGSGHVSATSRTESQVRSSVLDSQTGEAEAFKAIRCLYEDLTGIVIRSVDRLGNNNQPYPLALGDADTQSLRFKGLFASKGFFCMFTTLNSTELSLSIHLR